MDENVESTVDAAEYWKQARFHLGQLIQILDGDEVDVDEFREEFVEEGFEEEVFDAIRERL